MVWHKDTALPAGLDLVGVPGGFSFGDYLRCGAIAARSPVMRAVVGFAEAGGHVLGVCNGFQVLIEAGLLPGALMRNAGLKFVCAPAPLTVATDRQRLHRAPTRRGETHHASRSPTTTATTSPTPRRSPGSRARTASPSATPRTRTARSADIAGILSANRRVLGLMPHPERAADPAHGGTDGARLFAGLAAALGAGARCRALERRRRRAVFVARR